MGMMRQADIAAWQKRTGIKPVTGESGRLLDEIAKAAFELIRIVELERSGIRDGDGCWSGSDPLNGAASDLADLFRRFNISYRIDWSRSREVPPMKGRVRWQRVTGRCRRRLAAVVKATQCVYPENSTNGAPLRDRRRSNKG